MNILFNYSRPRYFEEENRWTLPVMGKKMSVKPIKEIRVGKNKEKGSAPWLQMFNCGYRVTTENIDWNTWNGCVYSDIDAKFYFNDCKPFDTEKLRNDLHDYLLFNYNYNYYGMQASGSGRGYHILFYFNVEKNEDSFRKCAQRVREIVTEAFTNIGRKDIIEWPKVADKCSGSPYQGMYLTDKPWLWGNSDQLHFGDFEDFECYEIQTERIRISDVQPDGEDLFTFISYKEPQKPVEYKNHYQRRFLYDALIAVFKDKDKVDEEWKKIAGRIPEENKHTHLFYEQEPEVNHWYKKYNGQYVKVALLEEFGYHCRLKFSPQQVDLYEPDEVYTLKEGQYLTDIDIKWDTERCNHVFAGCGFGKTYMAKEFSNSGKRVCFISPMTSINKDSFDKEDAKHWLIVDTFHKDEVEHVCGSVQNALERTWSICTTWESFWGYQMWKYKFDYFVVDEIHTLYMYDYRLESIAHMKDAIKKIKGIKILMTGTPSYEVEEFDCKKILVNRETKRVKAEVVFYNKSASGYIYQDIRNWINESPDNVALIFKDQTNYKTEDALNYYGIDCDVFNKQYIETVKYVIDNRNIKKQVTAFSVYGQAGINLDIDVNKKVRVYILNKNALGIIQYANRVRNKEVIDKVVIPYKNSKINNDIRSLNTKICSADAEKRVEMINSFRLINEVFDTEEKKRMFEIRYGLPEEVLDRYDDRYVLNNRRYEAYRIIKSVESYESQIQLIHNRLVSNYFDVEYVDLNKDVAISKHSQHRIDRFGGQMARFDWNMVQESRDGTLWIKATPEFNKVVTGDLKEVLEDILNRLYKSNGSDIKKTEADFTIIIHEIIRRKGGIKKKDVAKYDQYLVLKDYFNQYVDKEFLVNMTKDDWDQYREAARYTRMLFNETMDWKKTAKEVLLNLGDLVSIVSENGELFKNTCQSEEKIEIPDDEITKMIENYLREKFAKMKKKKSSVVIDGVRYSSISEAMKQTGLSRTTLWRRAKQAAQIDDISGAQRA